MQLVPVEQVLQAQAYILFYSRQDTSSGVTSRPAASGTDAESGV